MKRIQLLGTCALGVFLTVTAPQVSMAAVDAAPQLQTYATLVYKNYNDSYQDLLGLQKAVDALLQAPTDANLKAARNAWLKARVSYEQTEAFRFYEGPIDGADPAKGQVGLEDRINAWPLNEAYIDYVKGAPNSGIVNDSSVTITREALVKKNQQDDEANVATGYHAIEFLLWGQDLSASGPGNRTVSDYAATPANERRRAYLKVVTDLLVDDLKFLTDSWAPGADNYAKSFVAKNSVEALSNILTGTATLAGFEMASERMGTALDSGDQEDEQSCFSDNTHNDFIGNAKGISNVYFGTYGNFKGASVHDLLMKKDKALAAELSNQIHETERLIASIPHPIDREVLSTPKGSKGREVMEQAVASLQKEADLLVKAGKVLGVDVRIVRD